MLFKLDPSAERVIASLKSEPDEWTLDAHNITHVSGVSMWISNDAYALGLGVKGERYCSYVGPNEGNLNGYNRQRLWRAFRAWKGEQAKRGRDKIGEAFEAAKRAKADHEASQ